MRLVSFETLEGNAFTALAENIAIMERRSEPNGVKLTEWFVWVSGTGVGGISKETADSLLKEMEQAK